MNDAPAQTSTSRRSPETALWLLAQACIGPNNVPDSARPERDQPRPMWGGRAPSHRKQRWGLWQEDTFDRRTLSGSASVLFPPELSSAHVTRHRGGSIEQQPPTSSRRRFCSVAHAARGQRCCFWCPQVRSRSQNSRRLGRRSGPSFVTPAVTPLARARPGLLRCRSAGGSGGCRANRRLRGRSLRKLGSDGRPFCGCGLVGGGGQSVVPGVTSPVS